MATMKRFRYSVAAAVLLAIASLLLPGCEIFVDPAAPPFGDRIALTRRIDDVFALSPRSGVEMTVLDNGSGYFLLMRGPGRDGADRVVAFDSSLRIRMNRTDLWAIPFAAPDANGDFVIGDVLFSGSTFALVNPTLPVPGDSLVFSGSSTNALVSIVDTETPAVPRAGLRVDPEFDSDWEVPGGGGLRNYRIFRDPFTDPPDTDPLAWFELRSAQHDPSRNQSGLVLWNDILARHLVVVLSRSLADTPEDQDFLDVTPGATVVLLPTQDRDDPVFYTRRGIVVVRRDGDHEVYSPAGNRTASYRMEDRGDFDYAYSPDGRWVFVVDRQRGRLFRASTWW